MDGDWHGRAAMEVVDGVTVLIYKSGSAHDANDGALHIRFSDNYGETWSDEDKTLLDVAVTNFPMNPPDVLPTEDAGEPWLMIAPNGDLLCHMWCVDYGTSGQGTYQSRSTDGGETWSTPAAVDFVGVVDDTQVFATDDHFVYDGVIYAGARIHTPSQSPSESCLIKSTDNGATWEKVSTICASNEGTAGTGAWEVGIEYTGDSRIIAVLRMVDLTRTYQRISTDMGATWGALAEITSTVNASGRHRIFTKTHLRGGANWWTDQKLIMCGFELMTPGNSTPRRNAIWHSSDAGANWDGPYYLEDTSEDAGYGDLVYDPDTDKYIFVTYQGLQASADLVQYKFRLML